MPFKCEHAEGCDRIATSGVKIEYMIRENTPSKHLAMCVRHALEAFRDQRRALGYASSSVYSISVDGPAVAYIPSPGRTRDGRSRCWETTSGGILCVRPWGHAGVHRGHRRHVGTTPSTFMTHDHAPIDDAS